MELIPYETLLDAARQHFHAVAASPNYTREARHKALELERSVADELHASTSDGGPIRALVRIDLARPRRNDEEDHGVFAKAA